jgi:hypothetical protein
MEEPEEALAPVTPDWPTVHAKVVPATLLVSANEVAAPEQNDCEEGVTVILGIGLTVTVATVLDPVQPLAVALIVYVAVPGEVVVVVIVCAMLDPAPLPAPLTPLWLAIQLNELPTTLLLNANEVADPEQITWLLGVTVGVGKGFTVTVAVTTEPEHPFLVGVTE